MGTVANEVTESMGQSKRTRISSHTVWTVIYDDKKNIWKKLKEILIISS